MKSYKAICRNHHNLFFTCEHASTRIPRRYHRLGLTKTQLDGAKDLNDVGALAVMQDLARTFHASYLYATLSRLVIDINRQIDMDDLERDTFHASALKHHLLVELDGKEQLIEIPGNHGKTAAEEQRRFERYAVPYQQKGCEIAEKLYARHGRVFMVQIHSFFPYYNGEERTTDIGVLYKNSEQNARALVRSLQAYTSLQVDANKPWSLKDTPIRGSFDNLEDHKDIELITIEINNKHLRTPQQCTDIATLLAKSIKDIFIK